MQQAWNKNKYKKNLIMKSIFFYPPFQQWLFIWFFLRGKEEFYSACVSVRVCVEIKGSFQSVRPWADVIRCFILSFYLYLSLSLRLYTYSWRDQQQTVEVFQKERKSLSLSLQQTLALITAWLDADVSSASKPILSFLSQKFFFFFLSFKKL